MGAVDILISLGIPALVLIHLAVAPYTKVEESFNIQAVHDILVYGMPTQDVNAKLSHYDHFDFPGAVPRTFLGSVMLAGITQPIVAVIGFQNAQMVARATLGLFNAWSMLVFARNIAREFGRPTARWYTLLQASQFHIMFYASRTLPNMFAFGLTTLAFAQLVGDPQTLRIGRCKLAIALLTCATVIFRSELAILLTTTSAYLLLVRRLPIQSIIKAFSVTYLLSLAVSVPIDSYFWQKPLWPELWGFYYNAVLGSSSEWGVSVWHYYFTNALPKILGSPVVPGLLVPLALVLPSTAGRARLLAVPSILFVAIYSLQPHKEARFIFYVVPPLTAATALGANHIFTRRNKSLLYSFATFTLVVAVLAQFAASTGMLLISSLNYPGGEALSELRSLVTSANSSPDLQTVMVHTDVLSCMTGVTLFGQHPHSPIDPKSSAEMLSFVFDKTEDPTTLKSPTFWGQFDYLLMEDPNKAIGTWETVGFVEGFTGVEVLKPGMLANGGLEAGEGRVLGRGAVLGKVRERVRRITGGWWIGPKMEPRVRILKRLRSPPRKEVKQ